MIGTKCLSPVSYLFLPKLLIVNSIPVNLGTNVTVNAYHPGVVNTDGLRYMPFKQSTVIRFTLGVPFWFFTKTAKDGAQTPVYLSVAKEEEGVSGKFYA